MYCLYRYFPYVNDRETVPHSDNQFLQQAHKDAFGSTQLAVTQQRTTQQATAPAATREGSGSGEVICIESDDEQEQKVELVSHPIFEVFWQVSKHVQPRVQHRPTNIAQL
jgi:hypothetical protein